MRTARVGKTAFAVHAAHHLAARYPDGCLFLDLHGYTRTITPVDPGQALERLLRAVGVAGEQIPADVHDKATLYRSRLAAKRMLIVLDNARTAEQVRPLLPAGPGCLVLVTSRRRLTALDEARPLSLDILPVSDAVTLFTRIAGAGRSIEPADAVERVVELCGRLPLAVRIAAARLRARPAWTVAQLEDQLADQYTRLGELDDGERGVAAAFTLSYHDLTDEQQQMFRLLGLHPGADTDAYAAAALTGLNLYGAGRILEDLLDAHLLGQAVAGRYRFHDLMRAYAADLAHTHDSAIARHAALSGLFDHYLATTADAMNTLHPAERDHRPDLPSSRLPTPPVTDPTTARAWLNAERPNLVAVSTYAATHGWLDHTTSLSATLFRYLDMGGHYADGLTVHTHAQQIAEHTGNRTAEGTALTDLADAYVGQGHHAQAAVHMHRALAIFAEIGDRHGKARVLNNLGFIHWRLGPFQQGIAYLQQALTLFRELGDRLGEAHALDNLGLIYQRQGRDDEAADRFQQALVRYQAVGDRRGESALLGSLGAIRSRQGHQAQAIDYLQQSLTLSRDIGFRALEAESLDTVGLAHQRQGHHELAADYHRQAITLFRQIGDRAGESQALNSLGETTHVAGHPGQARDQHASALALTTQTDDSYERARAHAGLAHTHHATGDYRQARHHWEQALNLYTDLDVPADDIRAHLTSLSQATNVDPQN